MIKTLATLGVAVGLATVALAPSTATAQVVPLEMTGRSEQAIRSLETAMDSTQRISALAHPFIADPVLMSAPTPEAFAAQVELRRVDIAAARAEIQTIRTRLEALPRLSRPSDPPQMRASDQSIGAAIAVAGKIDGLLGDLLGVADAVAAGDRANAMRSLVSMATGALVLMESQAETLRSQANLMPEGTSSYGQFHAMACLSDGAVAIQLSVYGMLEPAAAAGRLDEARLCITRHTQQSRLALAREAEESLPPPVAALRTRITPLSRKILDELDVAAGSLETAAKALASGPNHQATLDTVHQLQASSSAITQYGQRQAQIAAEQLD